MASDPLAPRPSNDAAYTVTRLNQEVRGLIEDGLGRVWVEGEIANYSKPASGHIYFTLKDARAQVRCALFRGAQRFCCPISDGMQVLLAARPSLYEGRGDFQLLVEQMEDAGEGALRRAFETLKRALAAEGLFDAAHKKPLPSCVRRIGVITSPTGAVWHDILTTLKRRFPAIAVLLYPVPVQGRDAALRIAEMIDLANARGECDVLLLARGGGSLEDLWAFNEEVVARALFRSKLPVVSGVGHETDTTIADWVADVRAPTPTAAAELLSPDQARLRERVEQTHRRLSRAWRRIAQEQNQRLDDLRRRLSAPLLRLAERRTALITLERRLKFALPLGQVRLRTRLLTLTQRLRAQSPLTRLHTQKLRQATLPGRLQTALRHALLGRRQTLLALNMRLQHLHPGERLADLQGLRQTLTVRLVRGMRLALEGHRERLAHLRHSVELVGPHSILKRGYAIVTNDEGHVVRGSDACAVGESLRILLAQGELKVEVKSTQP